MKTSPPQPRSHALPLPSGGLAKSVSRFVSSALALSLNSEAPLPPHLLLLHEKGYHRNLTVSCFYFSRAFYIKVLTFF